MRLLVINISSSSLEINKLRRLLPAISVTTCGKVVRRCRGHNTWSVAALTVHSEARYRLRIAISAYPTCLRRPHYESSRRNIAMPFGTEELEWLGYPRVKKNWRYIIRFDRTHEHYRQTHRQTDTAWRRRPRLCIPSRGKNHDFPPISRFISHMMQNRAIVTIEGE